MEQSPLILNLANVMPASFANGPGKRMVVHTQGCKFHCQGCQNQHTWDFRLNQLFTTKELFELYQKEPNLDGISFSGGEPFLQAVALAKLAEAVRQVEGTVVCWTGFTLEQLSKLDKVPGAKSLLAQIDLLIDGLYIESQKCDDLVLRGSRNQRLHFLSGRIQEKDLINIPRQEFIVTEKSFTGTGFLTKSEERT